MILQMHLLDAESEVRLYSTSVAQINFEQKPTLYSDFIFSRNPKIKITQQFLTCGTLN